MTIAPGLRQWIPVPVGWVGRMQRDPLRFLVEVREQYGDVVRLHAGPWRFHLVAHPDHVRHVLLDHQKNYPRSWLYDRTKVAAATRPAPRWPPFTARSRKASPRRTS